MMGWKGEGEETRRDNIKYVRGCRYFLTKTINKEIREAENSRVLFDNWLELIIHVSVL